MSKLLFLLTGMYPAVSRSILATVAREAYSTNTAFRSVKILFHQFITNNSEVLNSMLKTFLLFAVALIISGCASVKSPQISNFEECVAADNPVMEAYPRQCLV
ncbi:MAG: hypothetical protein D3903_02115 [Candidatus Electrothrix sp. GM3_4]|nr:hypothetical protein [Candidatus Electrothrix sp. GM3_4]